MNLYDTLGVGPDASADAIKSAYRRLAQQYHPDKSTGNAEKFKAVQYAYEVLSDPERKAGYDRTGADPKAEADLMAQSVNSEATRVFLAHLNTAIEDGRDIDTVDILAQARTELHAHLVFNQQAQRTLGERMYEVKKAMRRLKRKGGDGGLLKEALLQRHKDLEAERTKATQSQELCRRVLDLYAEYEYEVEQATFTVTTPDGRGTSAVEQAFKHKTAWWPFSSNYN